ncbi:MAG: MptD family putative ECF transporter S component, partial [Eggerthella lenta]
MEHSPYETSKSRKGAAFEMWGVKEVVTAVLFSALMIVVMFVVGSVTMLGVDFSMLFMAATYVLVVAPLYMLMVMRVNRFGVTAFYACVMALVYLMFGNLWYMLPFYLVGGLAIDALFLRTAAQRAKPNRIVAAWATFSALYSLSSIIPILVNLQGYLQELAEVRMMGEEYV